MKYVKLGEYIEPISERNKDGVCNKVCSVTNSRGFVLSKDFFSKEVFSKELKNYKVVSRDMLAYNPSRINVGSVAVQNLGGKVVVSPLYVVFRAKNGLDPDYLVRFLKSDPGKDQIRFRASGTVRNNLKFDALSLIECPLYSLPMQREIVAALSVIESQISRANNFVVHLDNICKSRFVEMFGTASDKRCVFLPTEEVCEVVVDCPHETPKYQGDLKYPAIRTSELVGTTICWDTMKYVSEDEYQKRTRRLKPRPGDVVYAREGTYGNAAVLPKGKSFCLGQRIMLFRVDSTVCLPEFFLYALTSTDVRKQADELNVGTTVPHVNVRDAKKFLIPIPPLSLQREFADFATQVDKLKFETQQSIEKLQMLYDSLAQEYFAPEGE